MRFFFSAYRFDFMDAGLLLGPCTHHYLLEHNPAYKCAPLSGRWLRPGLEKKLNACCVPSKDSEDTNSLLMSVWTIGASETLHKAQTQPQLALCTGPGISVCLLTGLGWVTSAKFAAQKCLCEMWMWGLKVTLDDGLPPSPGNFA